MGMTERIPDLAGSLPNSVRSKKGFSVGPANLPDGIHKRKGIWQNAF